MPCRGHPLVWTGAGASARPSQCCRCPLWVRGWACLCWVECFVFLSSSQRGTWEYLCGYLGSTDSGRNLNWETEARGVYEQGKGTITSAEGKHCYWYRKHKTVTLLLNSGFNFHSVVANRVVMISVSCAPGKQFLGIQHCVRLSPWLNVPQVCGVQGSSSGWCSYYFLRNPNPIHSTDAAFNEETKNIVFESIEHFPLFF